MARLALPQSRSLERVDSVLLRDIGREKYYGQSQVD